MPTDIPGWDFYELTATLDDAAAIEPGRWLAGIRTRLLDGQVTRAWPFIEVLPR